MMTVPRNMTYALTTLAISLVAACSSKQAPKKPAPETVILQPSATQNASADVFAWQPRAGENVNQSLNSYRQLESVLNAVKMDNDMAASQFLAQQNNSAMAESVRNEWLKSLGKRQQFATFKQQYQQVEPEGRHQEVRCYAHLFGMENDAQFVNKLVRNTARLPLGCNTLLQNRAGSLNQNDAWRRVRGLISNNQITDARNLATALGGTIDGGSEGLLANAIRTGSTANLGNLNAQQSSFAWGVLGLKLAKEQNFGNAFNYYSQASDRSQFTDEQFEWYARSALRLQRWADLANIIETMPADLKKDPTWLYWLGRSYQHTGKGNQAKNLYQQAAQTGRNFYALLATEELGGRVNAQNNVSPASPNQVNEISRDGAIQRALNLFHTSQQSGDWKMRRQAQTEWRYATRGMNETTRLAAAQLAFNQQFYEMAIHSADSTDHLLNFNLRYITPFQNLVQAYSQQNGVDAAWVYGLIRQESRFVLGAQSSVGAQGLMQVMPATASMIARKLGMNQSELYTMDGNIRMGTWYMADARNNLQNNEVLATAGYNAGPGRARKWQASNSLEGAIYAETIPFNETRDYVKKVMANATYYSALMNLPRTSLKQRMGVVPARY